MFFTFFLAETNSLQQAYLKKLAFWLINPVTSIDGSGDDGLVAARHVALKVCFEYGARAEREDVHRIPVFAGQHIPGRRDFANARTVHEDVGVAAIQALSG